MGVLLPQEQGQWDRKDVSFIVSFILCLPDSEGRVGETSFVHYENRSQGSTTGWVSGELGMKAC